MRVLGRVGQRLRHRVVRRDFDLFGQPPPGAERHPAAGIQADVAAFEHGRQWCRAAPGLKAAPEPPGLNRRAYQSAARKPAVERTIGAAE